jgi:hypothetical protein
LALANFVHSGPRFETSEIRQLQGAWFHSLLPDFLLIP